jgi:hypothetical protein
MPKSPLRCDFGTGDGGVGREKGQSMSKSEIEAAIDTRLAERESSVRNRNALRALFGAFSDPVGSLGQIFLGGSDAVDCERQRLQQDAILELLCRIDEAISEVGSTAVEKGIEISGLIETSSRDGESVIGVEIENDAGPVRFQPGTHIKTTSIGTKTTTGLKIGGKPEE